MNGMSRVEIIQSRLEQAFAPSHLEVIDESDQHRGHVGYQGGGRHFAIIIGAEKFRELSRMVIHREIYSLFGDMMPNEIHALRIKIVENE